MTLFRHRLSLPWYQRLFAVIHPTAPGWILATNCSSTPLWNLIPRFSPRYNLFWYQRRRRVRSLDAACQKIGGLINRARHLAVDSRAWPIKFKPTPTASRMTLGGASSCKRRRFWRRFLYALKEATLILDPDFARIPACRCRQARHPYVCTSKETRMRISSKDAMDTRIEGPTRS